MFIELTQQDIDRSKVVKPNWYRVRITDLTSKISKDGGSTNIFFEGVILRDEKGNEEFAGVPTPRNWMVNSKAIGTIIPILAAIDPSFIPSPGQRIPLEGVAGQEIEAFIANGTYNNQIQNQMTGQYRTVPEKRTLG